MQLTNLGLALRPDLFDAHTIHWHGFRNVIPFFDGEPTGSVAVTTGRIFPYVYRPRDPGTYMFHCHVEDVEHVHMGMTGLVFVRPLQNGTNIGGSTRAASTPTTTATARPATTASSRCSCSEVWGESHWADAHIQLPEWSDYRADFCLLNGRVYPDTLAPNAPIDLRQFHTSAADADRRERRPDRARRARPDLQYQPLSALVTCNAGERVLLRFANLGFREAAMTLAGIKMQVVGKDATPMRGRDGTDTSYETNTVSFGAGESIDAIFTAPASAAERQLGPGLRHLRALQPRLRPLEQPGAVGGFGGQRTEVRVYPAGTLPPQTHPERPEPSDAHDREEYHHAYIDIPSGSGRARLCRLGLAVADAGVALLLQLSRPRRRPRHRSRASPAPPAPARTRPSR